MSDADYRTLFNSFISLYFTSVNNAHKTVHAYLLTSVKFISNLAIQIHDDHCHLPEPHSSVRSKNSTMPTKPLAIFPGLSGAAEPAMHHVIVAFIFLSKKYRFGTIKKGVFPLKVRLLTRSVTQCKNNPFDK
jgi:hypothetical protein